MDPRTVAAQFTLYIARNSQAINFGSTKMEDAVFLVASHMIVIAHLGKRLELVASGTFYLYFTCVFVRNKAGRNHTVYLLEVLILIA
jgi:hypothetical protein